MAEQDLLSVALQRLSDEIQTYLAGEMPLEPLQLTLRTLMATLPDHTRSGPLRASRSAIVEANDKLDQIQFRLSADDQGPSSQRVVRRLAEEMTAAWFHEGEDLAIDVEARTDDSR